MTPSPHDRANDRRPVEEEKEGAPGAVDTKRRSDSARPTVLRFAGAGVELAGMVLGGGFLGHLLDRYVLTMDRPWGLIGGTLIGFAAGMSHLILLANRFNRSSR